MDLAEALAGLGKGHQPTPPPGYLTVRQIADGAGVTVDAVKKWIADGRFPNAYRAGQGRTHPWFVPESDIVAAAGAQPQPPTDLGQGAWSIGVGCRGVECAACSTLLIAKRQGEKILTCADLIAAAVADHLATCKRSNQP